MNLSAAWLLIGLFSLPALSATLQGVVRDAKGVAVADATIQVNIGAKGVSTVRSDSLGQYRVASLAAGAYTLRIGDTSYGPFVLKGDETKTVDLAAKPAAAALDFSDEPNFTVAGVTDHTYVGGHGSDTVVRSAEALTKATASLSKDTAPAGASEAALHHRMAQTDEKQGKPLDAVREYQRAAELEASESNLYDWGTELLLHRAPEPAVEVFTKGIQLFPHSSRMLLGAAVALYSKGDYTRAARRFFEAADLNPGDPDPYLFLAKVQSPAISETPGFQDRLARFVKLQPDSAWANYYYALSLWKERKDTEQVESLLEKAARLDPTLGEVHLQLGILYSEQQNLPLAIRAYQQAIAANPQLEQAHYRLAQAYRQMEEPQKAQRELEIFRQLSKTSAEQLERERSELQQFVVTLKSPASNQ